MHHFYFFALKYCRRSIYISFLAAFLFVLPLCGQEAKNLSLQYTHYSTEDGLENQLIYGTFQDSRGFVWIMTNHSFSRFDGETFINYLPEYLGVEFGSINDIYEDADGNLWLSELPPSFTLGSTGLYIFNPDTEQIKPYQNADIPPYYSLEGTPEKQILAGTVDGKLLLCNKQKQDTVYAFADKRPIYDILSTNNYYWINSGKKLTLLKRNGEFVQEWSTTSRFELLGKKGENIYVRDIFLLDSSELNDRIMLYQADEVNPRIAPVNSLNNATQIDKVWKYYQKEKMFTVALEPKGLLLLEETGTDYYFVDSLIGDKLPFNVYDTYFGTDGHLWVSSSSGVYKIQITNSKFIPYLNEKDKAYSLRSIVVAGDSLYCNTYAGNIIYDIKKKEIVRELSNTNIGLSGIKASNGCIYLGGMGSALQQICANGGQERFFYHASNKTGLGEKVPHEFWAILEDSDSKIWIGTNAGLSFFNEEEGILKRFRAYNQFKELSEALIFEIIETKDKDTYWIASHIGLFKMERDKGITSWYHSGEPTPDSGYLPANSIIDIHEDADGILWLTTSGSGLIRFNPQDGSYKQLTVEQGLAHNVTNDILEDDFDNLWISTNKGLVCLNRKSGDLVTFDKSDGIHMDEFNKKSSAKLGDGRFIFGGLDGFVAFHPKDFLNEENKETRSHLNITQVVIGDSIKNAIDTKEPIVLSDTKIKITINLHLLEFTDNKPAVYEWKWKKDQDSEFKKLPNFQFHISDIPYGESTLVFRATSANGTPALNEVELSFSTPALLSWKQIIGGIIVLFGLYFFLFRAKKNDTDEEDKKPTQVIIIEDKETRQDKKVEKESPKVPLIILSPADKKWLDNLTRVIEQKTNIGQFSVEDMAREVNLSSRQLNRKIKQLTGITPNQFLRDIKLEKAKALLESGTITTVAEASFSVGFEKPDYFSRLFKEKYGVRPISYFDKKKRE